MRLDYEVTKNDRASFARSIVHLSSRLGLNIVTVVSLSLAMLLLYHFCFGIHRELLPPSIAHLPLSQLSVIIHFLIFGLVAILTTIFLIYKVKQRYQRLMSHSEGHISLRYDDRGIEYQTKHGLSHINWAKLHAIIKLNSGIYLYSSKNRLPNPADDSCIIIPRNAFHSEQAYRSSVFFIQHRVEKIRQVA